MKTLNTSFKLFALVLVIVTSLLSVLSNNVYGYSKYASQDNREPYNYSENDARNLCASDPDSRRGAIWFSNNPYYYDDSVTVTSGATSVDVTLRGSFFSCSSISGGSTMDADQIKEGSPSTGRLTGISSSDVLSRGSASNNWEFSGQGGYLDAKLDVSGLGNGTTGCRSGTTCSVIYIQVYRCPITGSTCYDSPVRVTVERLIQWTLVPSIVNLKVNGVDKVSGSWVKPADLITWTHGVENTGPDPTHIDNTTDYINSQGLGTGTGSNRNIPAGLAKNASITPYSSSHTVSPDDGGNNLCRATRVWWQASDNSSAATSGAACVYVPYNYNLAPRVTLNVSGVIETGTPFDVTARVNNTFSSSTINTRSAPTTWSLSRIIVAPGGAIPQAAGGNTASSVTPCSYFTNATATCTVAASGTGARYPVGDTIATPPSVTTESTTDLEVGTKICYSFSVRSREYTNDVANTEWAHAKPECVILGKKPKVQIWGGDLSAGSVGASTSVKAGNTFGSWVEYAIYARGSIKGVASGASFAGPNGMAGATVAGYSPLSFSNANNTSCGIGCYYSSNPSLPDIGASFSNINGTVSGTVTPSNLNGTYNFTGNITLDSSQMASGKSVILKGNGTVTIAGNQTYATGPYNSISQIPQLVIIADKIIINSGVTQVDAWLVARTGSGVIETCDTGSGSFALTGSLRLTNGKCSQQLVVNGPVIANQVWLRRTAGSDSGTTSDTAGKPAEIFNLRTDAYLWAMSRSTGAGRIQTVYTTELPPRY